MRHRLDATPQTTAFGVIDPNAQPVLTVESGDEIEITTIPAFGGEIDAQTTYADLPALRERITAQGALGPHTLTGPIAVEGAKPGDVLRVDILDIVPGPHAWNAILPGGGALPHRFPEGSLAHYALDRETMTTEIAPGLTHALAPFLGIMCVAPPGDEVLSTVPPGPFGGNIDLRDLVAGTMLRLPVFHEGAGFWIGDAHAGQGDGEVDQTALETTVEPATVRLTLEPGPLSLPRAETDEHVIVLGFHEDLDEAARIAVGEATDLIAVVRGIEPEEAYRLCSIAVDFGVTQVVNRVKGVHGRIPKALLA